MGVLVNDQIEVPGIGITISEFTITCKGSYEVSKEVVNQIAVYHIRTTLFWFTNQGTLPIYAEQLAFSVNEVPADKYAEIYNRVKARYQSTVDV
jgi:hypothetical protein